MCTDHSVKSKVSSKFLLILRSLFDQLNIITISRKYAIFERSDQKNIESIFILLCFNIGNISGSKIEPVIIQ